jgi:hypothetical protein
MSTPNPLPALSDLLSEAEGAVSYRPQLARITGSVTAAILLQQIVYHWNAQGRTAFYKFKEPCDSPYYQAGQSWCEELAFTRHEFDGALGLIATKVTRGLKNGLSVAAAAR